MNLITKKIKKQKDLLTKSEIKWIRENLYKMTNDEMAKVFKYTTARFRYAMHRHGIARYERNLWDEEEINFLKENHNRLTDQEIANHLGRAKKGVQKKRNSLNLRMSDARRSEIGRMGQKKMSRPCTYRDEGEIWRQRSTKKWMIKKNGQVLAYRRWAYETYHGPIPPGAKVFWKDDDNSAPDPSKVHLRPPSLPKDFQKAKYYVKGSIHRQNKKSIDYYISNGYDLVGCRFGSVWVNLKYKGSRNMKAKIEAINRRWPRHWKVDNK